jgi:hypothetical protein
MIRYLLHAVLAVAVRAAGSNITDWLTARPGRS